MAVFVAKFAGYNASLLTMAAIATLALIFFWFSCPKLNLQPIR
ncbi:MAG: hypothetical protein V7K69_26720 [Nostoc sp.]